ncbi:hypothetical protein [Prosthecobacter sp.]|uniref:hypothetical protein n=1 Tax=Prosthecobacter sp. TaxID=1965333 RepID=UPI0037831278
MNSILIIGQLLDAVGAVEGRKKFQKLVHILQYLKLIPSHFKFGYLHYGPYSEGLDVELRTFGEEGLIQEEQIETGPYKAYRFTAKEKLTNLVKKLGDSKPLSHAEVVKELNGKSSLELEAISTILYLRSSGKDGKALKDTFCELKPKLAKDFEQRLKAARELEKRVLPKAA